MQQTFTEHVPQIAQQGCSARLHIVRTIVTVIARAESCSSLPRTDRTCRTDIVAIEEPKSMATDVPL